MTAPTLERMKFWIVVPKYAENQIKNPTFASPDFAEDWAVKGASGVISTVSDESRWGVYSMKVTPVTGVDSVIYYAGLSVENALDYTFSCYVKGVAAQTMRILITDSSGTAKATTTFTATGYWQRVEVKWTSNANASDYQAHIIRNSVASVLPFYVDGAQFEQNSAATTFFDGYFPGCHWTGSIRNSTSARSDNTGLGGELLCINDYAKILSVHGFGMGQWNQIMTKVLENKAVKRFPKPAGLITMSVCNLTGQLPPEEGCELHNELFKKEFVPKLRVPLQNNILIDKTTNKIVKEGEDNPNAEWQKRLSVQDVTGEWVCLDCPKNEGNN